MVSLMNDFLGYSKILISPKDYYKTALTTTWDTFIYKLMLFGLKSARETYKKDMVYIFDNLLESIILIYINDILSLSYR